jgi:hypothetical protein
MIALRPPDQEPGKPRSNLADILGKGAEWVTD